MNALIVIQARLKATRLPGKVLAKIGDMTVLEHVYRRASAVGRTVVAISKENALADFCDGHGIEAYMAPAEESDVLARYAETARAFSEPGIIVRITADCPFIRPEDIRAVVGGLVLSNGADYAWNVGEPRQCPDGYDVEAFTWGALMRAHGAATDPSDREHVTTWMRRNLRCVYVPTHTGMGRYRWTLDTADDLEWMRGLAHFFDVRPGVGPTQERLMNYHGPVASTCAPVDVTISV